MAANNHPSTESVQAPKLASTSLEFQVFSLSSFIIEISYLRTILYKVNLVCIYYL